jgi:hypothetical protein
VDDRAADVGAARAVGLGRRAAAEGIAAFAYQLVRGPSAAARLSHV